MQLLGDGLLTGLLSTTTNGYGFKPCRKTDFLAPQGSFTIRPVSDTQFLALWRYRMVHTDNCPMPPYPFPLLIIGRHGFFPTFCALPTHGRFVLQINPTITLSATFNSTTDPIHGQGG